MDLDGSSWFALDPQDPLVQFVSVVEIRTLISGRSILWILMDPKDISGQFLSMLTNQDADPW